MNKKIILQSIVTILSGLIGLISIKWLLATIIGVGVGMFIIGLIEEKEK